MDAPEEDLDVKVQKDSPELLADFESSLKPFLWRALPNGELKIRKRVRMRETDRLVGLLSPHQENPQLLDPYLEKLLRILSDAFLEYLKSVKPAKNSSTETALLISLSEAICKLLYTFCKIRGEKVIVRFFNAEPKNLEPLLSAVEYANDGSSSDSVSGGSLSETRLWSWEERYITILWLSHLLLAPFDLASISSDEPGARESPSLPGMNWPPNLPGVALRVVPLAIKYLACAGKERDAAKALLVRISMRKDMQELGLLHALIEWALLCLQSSTVTPDSSPYYFIGILSYVGGVLVSSMSTSDMDSYLTNIFQTVQAVSDPENVIFKSIHTSALARKTVIKVIRSVVVLILRPQSDQTEDRELLEESIRHMMEGLADNDTPVRLAASKALSIITLKLPADLAAQVVDAVLAALDENVFWVEEIFVNESGSGGNRRGRDLSRVNPLEWHGLILTLSHLLYRHSPATNSLPRILHALLIGLNFEQRSTSGSSIGTNIRDAACFGIWAVARRYSTEEMRNIEISSGVASFHSRYPGASTIQILATELVVSASLDPAGNIRRGASAALQELIGRHQNTVLNGIAVVQVVDYHSVALRSRALLDVAQHAALLSAFNETGLLGGLLGWRGVGDALPSTRRTAAAAVGCLLEGFSAQPIIPLHLGLLPLSDTGAKVERWTKASALIQRIERKLSGLATREVDLYHGLLLSLAAVISSLPSLLTSSDIDVTFSKRDTPLDKNTDQIEQVITLALKTVFHWIEHPSFAADTVNRRLDLFAESLSCLVSAVCPLLWSNLSYDDSVKSLDSDSSIGPRERDLIAYASNRASFACWRDWSSDGPVNRKPGTGFRLDGLIEPPLKSGRGNRNHQFEAAIRCIAGWIRKDEKEATGAVTDAAVDLLKICAPDYRKVLLQTWISDNTVSPSLLFTLTKAFPLLDAAQRIEMCDIILNAWEKAKGIIETRVFVLQSIISAHVINSNAAQFLDMISEGLDDYTTDGRGDIGSLVRIQALKAAGSVFASIPWDDFEGMPLAPERWFMDVNRFGTLAGKVLRLAGEKLDKVRAESRACIALLYRDRQSSIVETGPCPTIQLFESNSLISSPEYFVSLLDLQTNNWLHLPGIQYRPYAWRLDIFEGLVSSAYAGSEDLIRASRTALVRFCEASRFSETDGIALQSAKARREYVAQALFELLQKHEANDRILVPALESISFLFDMRIMQGCEISWKALYLLVQKVHYKSTNVRKLEACVKLYGGLVKVHPRAMDKLTSMLLHPYPQIRNLVVDIVFVKSGIGKGVNWPRAKQEDVAILRAQLASLVEAQLKRS